MLPPDARVLIYKRTHKGDPDQRGQFGINCCMGSFRSRDYYAVIGIGGTSERPVADGIDRKLNWIGVGAKRHPINDGTQHLVTFDRFVLYEDAGRDFEKIAPIIARQFYEGDARQLVYDKSRKDRTFSREETAEINFILSLADNAKPSNRKSLPMTIDCKSEHCGCSTPKERKKADC